MYVAISLLCITVVSILPSCVNKCKYLAITSNKVKYVAIMGKMKCKYNANMGTKYGYGLY